MLDESLEDAAVESVDGFDGVGAVATVGIAHGRMALSDDSSFKRPLSV